jgi:hypothetical protein
MGYNSHERFEVKRINHEEAYSLDGACTNMAEEYFSGLRRAEIDIRHHIAGAYLFRYAQESSWREDNRKVSNGDQVNRIAGLALKRSKSVDFTDISSGMSAFNACRLHVRMLRECPIKLRAAGSFWQ